MTIAEALQTADALRKNQLAESIKIRWLSELEGKILSEIVGLAPEKIPVFTEKTPQILRLFAPAPYDRVYWTYLLKMIDYAIKEADSYQMSTALFKEAYEEFAKWFLRTKGGRM